jgi:hypothetical protein
VALGANYRSAKTDGDLDIVNPFDLRTILLEKHAQHVVLTISRSRCLSAEFWSISCPVANESILSLTSYLIFHGLNQKHHAFIRSTMEPPSTLHPATYPRNSPDPKCEGRWRERCNGARDGGAVIAIGAGTDVAVESAGIVLVRSDPRDPLEN